MFEEIIKVLSITRAGFNGESNYFVPSSIEFVKKDKKYIGISLKGATLEVPELFEVFYRSICCSKCKKTKQPSEFHWKEKGVEGPFSRLWGKRDSFCKTCRSKEKSEKYKQKTSVAKIKEKRRLSSKTLDITNFKVVKTYGSNSKGGREAAYKYLIERIFARGQIEE